jgi:hypothetical protein
LLVTRADRMTAVELHEILLLGAEGYAYTTEAVLKQRLGV